MKRNWNYSQKQFSVTYNYETNDKARELVELTWYIIVVTVRKMLEKPSSHLKIWNWCLTVGTDLGWCLVY